MKQHQQILHVDTRSQGFVRVDTRVVSVVKASGIRTGLCTIFIQHTSASLIIQENADPAVLRDLGTWIDALAPTTRNWEHDAEGPDDMPAHARSAITKTGETIPVVDGKLALGTWQGLYIWEHRSAPHTRKLVVHVLGTD